ncbi:glycosyltransferase [Butyrivibrio sp. AE3004]|uniref:glycosyltransferase n=1 Tax=Butyrivibrio sp. AE3004 TaxID=1506994 RepID=UPI0004949A37|nr:glycosyltransferase [Butyrivibrio sp. AE3004]
MEKIENKVSVIIPIYNGSIYIENLFDQFDRQTYTRLEILFIDDGSTDGSDQIINNMILGREISSKQYRLIIQQNTGQGGARNRGIEEATGDYLVFVDQDDYIKEDYIEQLLKKATLSDCDIVISGYEHVTIGGEVKEHVELTNSEWCRFMNITPWGKIYRTAYVIENKIRFLPVPLGEDIYFNILCYSLAKQIAFTDYVGYQWVINEKSVSNTVHKAVSEESNVLRLFEALINMDSAENWTKDDQYRYFILKTGIFHLLYAAKDTTVKRLLEYRDEIFQWMDHNIPGIEKNELISYNKPVGERTGVRYAVFIFMILRRLRLDGMFLRFFHFM